MFFQDMVLIFCLYAFFGWCLEVSYAAVNSGLFVNRGFLNGPACPVYGFGALTVIQLLSPAANNLFLLFFGSVFLATTLEYITGAALKKLFHHKWWDYSNEPFNLNGYVCLKFSLMWGIACVFVIRIIHPLVLNTVVLIPPLLKNAFMTIALLILIVDLASTIASVLKLNFRLKQIEEVSISLRNESNVLGKNISEEAIKLKEKYNMLTKQMEKLHTRHIKAFPNIKSTKYFRALEDLKDYILK